MISLIMKMRSTLCWMFGVMLVLLVAGALPAMAQTTKWVDQAGGSDADDGNTAATAYATLQFAIDNSTSGTAGTPSVINVKDGTYGITGQVNQFGFATAILIEDLDFLTIQAVPGHSPVVKPVTGIEANIVSISIDNCDGLVIDDIDSDQTVAQFDNWHVFDSDDMTVRNCTFEGGEDGIDFNTSLATALIETNSFIDINTGNGDEVLDFTDGSYGDVVIQDNFFNNNYRHITINPPSGHAAAGFIIRRNFMDGTTSQEGVRINAGGGPVTEVLLENNVILNSRQQGLYVQPHVAAITVQHNTFFNNSEEEMRLRTAAGDVILKNNVIYANGTHAAISARAPFPPGPLPFEDFNLIFNDGLLTESSSALPITLFGPSTLTGVDPLFVSTGFGSEDLHLTAASPAIEAGTDLGVTDDNEKNSRPNPTGTDPDMGAYEFAPPEVCDPLPRTQGYWHRQCLGTDMIMKGPKGKGGPKNPTEPNFEDLETVVSQQLSLQLLALSACNEGMFPSPPSDPCQRALKQYTAMLFNLASGRLQGSCEIDPEVLGCDSKTLGDLVDEIAALILSDDSDNCKLAAACADEVNNGGGFVPLEAAASSAAGPAGALVDLGLEPSRVPTPVSRRPARTGAPSGPGLAPAEPPTTGLLMTNDQILFAMRMHLAVLANARAPERARSASINALLTPLGGGYPPEVRLQIVEGMIGKVDVAFNSLLGKYLEDIRAEARENDDEALAKKAVQQIKRLKRMRK